MSNPVFFANPNENSKFKKTGLSLLLTCSICGGVYRVLLAVYGFVRWYFHWNAVIRSKIERFGIKWTESKLCRRNNR